MTSVERILACMPSTMPDIERSTGLSHQTVWKHVDKLHTAGQIRIGAWNSGFKRPVAVFELGSGPDIPKPPLAKKTLRNRKYRKPKPAPKPVAAPPRSRPAIHPLMQAMYGSRW